MAERALAHVEKIEWVKPIEGADNIELIGVLGWVCVAKKENFSREIWRSISRSTANVRRRMNGLRFLPAGNSVSGP